MVSEEQAIPAEEDEHVIDLSGIATDLAPLDRGYYHFMVEEPPKKRFTDDDPDRPYYAWVLTITEPEELAGRKLFTNTTLQEHALFGFKRMLLGLGWTPESLEAGPVRFVPGDAVGCEGVAFVRPEEWPAGSGTMRNRVQRILVPGEEIQRQGQLF